MPVRLASPCVPRMPARLLWDAGMRIDPQVSLPMPTAAKLAAMAAPVPPLEPPGLRTRLSPGAQRMGGGEGVAVDGADGIQRRPFLIVGVNPGQVHGDQVAGGHRARR